MKLTAYQRRHLEALVYLKGKKPGVWTIITFRPLGWLSFVAIAGVSFFFYRFLDARWGLFMMGMTVGAVLRIISHARFAIMAWPVTEEVTDWARVEALRRDAGKENDLRDQSRG